ncbi:phosphodiesterase [Sphingobium sp. AN641]|uniref:phosphodiesterase n=1 Tax=Sphingobium sp. AN641 TaxID=3133443 RepID=UPI0030C4CA07
MLIAQITDLHLGFAPGDPAELNQRRLDAVLDILIDGPNRPDLLLATGDLTEYGDIDSYRRLAQAFARCPFPVWPCLGNHDDRANFRVVFPAVPMADGFVQYEVALEGVRLLLLDTLEEGRHGGAFCETRAAWLTARLEEQRDVPTLVILHHPPVEVGIEWMNTDPCEPWVARLGRALADAPQVRGLLCGHVHRPIAAAWRGLTVTICPSTAPQVALDLSPIVIADPDGRPMIVAQPPAFALHRWTAQGLVSHFENADAAPVLARYDSAMQPLIRGMLHERP